MGFGSYDESEQQDQDVNASDEDAVTVHENNYEGAVEFNTDASTDDLLDKLGEIKEADAETEED